MDQRDYQNFNQVITQFAAAVQDVVSTLACLKSSLLALLFAVVPDMQY